MSATSITDTYRPMIEADGERARRELRDLAAADPTSLEVASLLANAYLRCMDFAEAEAALRKVLALNPLDAFALPNLGLCLYAQGDWPGALEAFSQMATATGSTDAFAQQGLLLHRLGRRDEAAKAYETILMRGSLDGANQWPAMRGMMNLLRDRGRPLAADHYAHELMQRFHRQTLLVPSSLLKRDQATSFHEWYSLVDKSRLSGLLRKGLAEDPVGGRAPESFNLPEERAELIAFARAQPPGVLYIVKPIRGSGGQGISVVADVAEALDRTDVVVQRYIDRPYLVDGRKGHLRVYGLVTSVEPLRAYVYTEGVVRFAPEPYDPRPERLAEISMHVTNTALHKGHPSLVISQDAELDDVGSIWSISALKRRMQADGLDAEAVSGRIGELVAWFLRLLKREGLFARQAALAPARSFALKLFGLDVLVDADGMPWLIEVQAAPAATGAALVNRINGELYQTIFSMSVGTLLEDGMSADAAGAILNSPEGMAARELEIELANRGRFTPLAI
ncbi:MAG: tetratricopeptide repeat protein [Phenylobacterium sp.]